MAFILRYAALGGKIDVRIDAELLCERLVQVDEDICRVGERAADQRVEHVEADHLDLVGEYPLHHLLIFVIDGRPVGHQGEEKVRLNVLFILNFVLRESLFYILDRVLRELHMLRNPHIDEPQPLFELQIFLRILLIEPAFGKQFLQIIENGNQIADVLLEFGEIRRFHALPGMIAIYVVLIVDIAHLLRVAVKRRRKGNILAHDEMFAPRAELFEIVRAPEPQIAADEFVPNIVVMGAQPVHLHEQIEHAAPVRIQILQAERV